MKEKIDAALDGLKDFQRKTVDYVFDQLYVNNRNKMLIADEVGLGKTVVAKGIIAKAFDQFVVTSKRPAFNVVYICSNQALAKQNLAKLNFTGNPLAIEYSDADDRITSLAYESPKGAEEFPFRIKAFTPATSFDDKTHAGRADERILLYRLLCGYADFENYKNSLQWILKGNRKISDDTWERKVLQADESAKGYDVGLSKIRWQVYSGFRESLREVVAPNDLPKSFSAIGVGYSMQYWTLLKNLCKLGLRKNNYHKYNFQRELISSLRFKLSKVCLEFLNADIFILDEFQRYKQLISRGIDDGDYQSPAIELAREIFSMKDSKILMLSATPFKPYTNDFDEMNGEVHYSEFKTVLQFLMDDKPVHFWDQYEKERKSLFNSLRHPDSLAERFDETIQTKLSLETLYRTSMVRTEKLLASTDRDAMIKHMDKAQISVHPEDVHDFVAFDRVAQLLNKKYQASLAVPIEYVKSSPYSLSFLDHYAHKEKIRKYLHSDDELKQLLRQTRHAWLNLNNIDQYKPLIPKRGNRIPNAKLRLLLQETVENGWKYLWAPPSIPYYEFSGAYHGSNGFSKTLLFSSWKMVPKMVSSVVSYEAERLSVGNKNSVSEKEQDEKRSYFLKRRYPRPQFTFKVEKDAEPGQMNNFMLTYPSLFLASYYDPATNLQTGKTSKEIRKELARRLKESFSHHGLNDYVTGVGDWKRWFWLAPLLFDKATNRAQSMRSWLENGIQKSDVALDSEEEEPDKDETSGRARHFNFASTAFEDRLVRAPKLTGSQLHEVCSHLADLIVGSPAICFLRSVRNQHFAGEGDIDQIDNISAAYHVASSFLSLFNKPESIAVVRLHTTSEFDYHHRVLAYCIDGNIQSMLDEYVYLLGSGENLQTVDAVANFISDVLSVRTANTEVDDLKSFLHSANEEKKVKKSIRAHYAVDFGTQRIGTGNGGRQINIRQAFNSPFRPFVLASTSIGQEGLDFHLYCRKIFHWNLPSNPIDFEQREGRIHRYQGLVIRLNLAEKYKNQISVDANSRNLWKRLFEVAAQEKNDAPFPCDLVPFWHTETSKNISIERFVPLYPFSRDIAKFENMIKVLTFYRLTFGQPRQEELVDALHGYGFKDEDIKRLDDLMLNLTPIKFMRELETA